MSPHFSNANLRRLVSSYDAVLSDFDGTAVMSEQIHAAIGSEILRGHGVPDMTYDERFAMMGMGEFGIHEALANQGRTPTISAEEFKKQQCELFIKTVETMHSEQILRPGFKDLVIATLDAGKPFHIVSNTAKDAVNACMVVTGLDKLIPPENVITFDDIQSLGLKKKPHPDPYNLAIQRCQIPNGRFLAIEDSSIGLQSALNANCDTLEIFYDSIGRTADPRATYSLPDSRSLCSIFDESAENSVVPLQQRKAALGPSPLPPRP